MIGEYDIHVRSEYPACNGETRVLYLFYKSVVQFFCLIGRHRAVERRPPPLAGVGVQRELRDNHDPSADIESREIHLPPLVFEYPQVKDLVGQPGTGFRGIAVDRTEQQEQARPDRRMALTVDPDLAAGRSLQYHFHTGISING